MHYSEEEMSAFSTESRSGLKNKEDPRIVELTDEFYRRFHDRLPHLRRDETAAKSLWELSKELATEQAGLERLAVLDTLLPDFFKHQYFLTLLGEEINTSQRSNRLDTALVTLDLDNFGDFNTKFGHPEGDKLLKTVAGAIHRSIRHGDIPGRIGGDEMGILVHRVNSSGAVAAARRIEDAVYKASQEKYAPEGWNQTFSAGVCMIEPGYSVELARKISDQALYAAKEAGRNRIAIGMFDSEAGSIRTVIVKPQVEELILAIP